MKRDVKKDSVTKIPDIILVLCAYFFVIFLVTYNFEHPVSYEDTVVQVVDKMKNTVPVPIGQTVVPRWEYYLIIDDDFKVKVSHTIYKETEIDDYISVTYKIRDNKIIGVTYKKGGK